MAPTLLDPLPTESAVAAQVDPDLWRELVKEPLGGVIERRFRDDVVRGVVATDALIGTFADLHEPSLVQNRCFLYHLIGNGTGEWQVPVGGMGAVTEALLSAAVGAGAEVLTGAGVSSIDASDDGAEVTWHDGDRTHTVSRAAACCPASRRGCCGSCSARSRSPTPSPRAPSSRSTSCSTGCPR